MVKNPPASAGDKSDPWSDKQQSSEACVPLTLTLNLTLALALTITLTLTLTLGLALAQA